jgi:hypothetical protein
MFISMETAVQISAIVSIILAFVGLGIGVHFTTREVSEDTRDGIIVLGVVGAVLSLIFMGVGVKTSIQMEVAAIGLALSTPVAFIGIGMRIAYRKPN